MSEAGALNALSTHLEHAYLDLQDSVVSLIEDVNVFEADFSALSIQKIDASNEGPGQLDFFGSKS